MNTRDRALEVLGLTSGRFSPASIRDIAPRHGVVRVEQKTDLARDTRQLIDGDPAHRAVDQEAQHGSPPFGAVLDVDELEPRRRDDGLCELPDAPGDR
jgi:hypothetical protein